METYLGHGEFVDIRIVREGHGFMRNEQRQGIQTSKSIQPLYPRLWIAQIE